MVILIGEDKEVYLDTLINILNKDGEHLATYIDCLASGSLQLPVPNVLTEFGLPIINSYMAFRYFDKIELSNESGLPAYKEWIKLWDDYSRSKNAQLKIDEEALKSTIKSKLKRGILPNEELRLFRGYRYPQFLREKYLLDKDRQENHSRETVSTATYDNIKEIWTFHKVFCNFKEGKDFYSLFFKKYPPLIAKYIHEHAGFDLEFVFNDTRNNKDFNDNPSIYSITKIMCGPFDYEGVYGKKNTLYLQCFYISKDNKNQAEVQVE